MPAKVYYESDAGLDALQGKTVAVIGYGSQGHAHALNLRDSGIDVVVGLHEGSKSRAKAEAEGLRVTSVADAVRESDVIMVLVPDHIQKRLYEEEIAPNLAPGKTLMFAHGFNIHFGAMAPPPGIDVAMIAPKSPGHRLRAVPGGVGVPAPCRPPGRHGRATDTALAMPEGWAHCGPACWARRSRRRRDRLVRRASGALRRRQQSHRSRVQHARRRRVPTGDRLFRVPARAQADRRSHLRRRPRVHALLGERHREFGDYYAGPKVIDDHVKETMRGLLGVSRMARLPRSGSRKTKRDESDF